MFTNDIATANKVESNDITTIVGLSTEDWDDKWKQDGAEFSYCLWVIVAGFGCWLGFNYQCWVITALFGSMKEVSKK